jgi:hypothetical protein
LTASFEEFINLLYADQLDVATNSLFNAASYGVATYELPSLRKSRRNCALLRSKACCVTKPATRYLLPHFIPEDEMPAVVIFERITAGIRIAAASREWQCNVNVLPARGFASINLLLASLHPTRSLPVASL